ncbi:MAG: histidine kinase, partial [Bacteroidota bacterium]
LAEVELKSLQGQMNPHFLFNSLNSIKHFILTNDKFVAADYLTNFSKLVRLILNNSKQKTISLQQELETLKLYLEMEQMRFPQKFKFEIELSPALDPEELEIPPLILQPYVENAIWHGLMHKRDGSNGLIKVAARPVNNYLYFIIEDNGIGREKAMELRSKSAANRKSYGMQITHARLTMTDQNAQVKIIDLKNDAGEATGTRVELRLPYAQED